MTLYTSHATHLGVGQQTININTRTSDLHDRAPVPDVFENIRTVWVSISMPRTPYIYGQSGTWYRTCVTACGLGLETQDSLIYTWRRLLAGQLLPAGLLCAGTDGKAALTAAGRRVMKWLLAHPVVTWYIPSTWGAAVAFGLPRDQQTKEQALKIRQQYSPFLHSSDGVLPGECMPSPYLTSVFPSINRSSFLAAMCFEARLRAYAPMRLADRYPQIRR